MKTFIVMILILLPAIANSNTCQVNGQYVYCPQSTMQNLNNGFYSGPRPHQTIEPNPVQPITINPYSRGYYQSQDQRVPLYERLLDPYGD